MNTFIFKMRNFYNDAVLENHDNFRIQYTNISKLSPAQSVIDEPCNVLVFCWITQFIEKVRVKTVRNIVLAAKTNFKIDTK